MVCLHQGREVCLLWVACVFIIALVPCVHSIVGGVCVWECGPSSPACLTKERGWDHSVSVCGGLCDAPVPNSGVKGAESPLFSQGRGSRTGGEDLPSTYV